MKLRILKEEGLSVSLEMVLQVLNEGVERVVFVFEEGRWRGEKEFFSSLGFECYDCKKREVRRVKDLGLRCLFVLFGDVGVELKEEGDLDIVKGFEYWRVVDLLGKEGVSIDFWKVMEVFFRVLRKMRKFKIEGLRKEWEKCYKCDKLVKSRKRIVFGDGNIESDVVVIGEAPGVEEDEIGVPFVGSAGKVLNGWLDLVGLGRGGVYVTNAVCCFPGSGKTPGVKEVENCNVRLKKFLKMYYPRLVICVGGVAGEAVLGIGGVSLRRGKYFVSYLGCDVYWTYHPAYFLRGGGGRSVWAEIELEEDLKRIEEIVKEKKL